MEKEIFKLTEQESIILRDICFARNKVLKAGNVNSVSEVPIHTELTGQMVRFALSVFDFFQCAYHGNEKGIKKQAALQQSHGEHAGSGYYDGMIADYFRIMNALMDGAYTAESVTELHDRLKNFLKSQRVPARTLYIADCHFYHNRLCQEMDKRGFSGFEEMNEYMVRQWNGKVTKKDDVYILGDFSVSRPDAAIRILEQLNGNLHLIIGNHDQYLEDKHYDWTKYFKSIEYYQEIRDRGRTVILSHYPVFCYKGQYRKDKEGNPKTYMLYGHVHNTHDEELVNRFITETKETKVMSKYAEEPESIPCNMVNCFCMFSNYQPLTLDEWIVVDEERRERMNGCETCDSR